MASGPVELRTIETNIPVRIQAVMGVEAAGRQLEDIAKPLTAGPIA